MKKCNCGGGSEDNEFNKPIGVPVKQSRLLASPVKQNKQEKNMDQIVPFINDNILQLLILGGVATAIILIVIKKC